MSDKLIRFAESDGEGEPIYWAEYTESGKKEINSIEIDRLFMYWVVSPKAIRYTENVFIIYDFEKS